MQQKQLYKRRKLYELRKSFICCILYIGSTKGVPTPRIDYHKRRISHTYIYQFMNNIAEIPMVLIYKFVSMGEIPTVPIYHVLPL